MNDIVQEIENLKGLLATVYHQHGRTEGVVSLWNETEFDVGNAVVRYADIESVDVKARRIVMR